MTTDHLDSGLVAVVLEAYKNAFSVQSDFARREAEFVAMAASLGLLTTKVHRNVFSRHWRATVKGLMFLESLKLTEEEPEEDLSDVELYNSLEDS
jgi:hypothetical protein